MLGTKDQFSKEASRALTASAPPQGDGQQAKTLFPCQVLPRVSAPSFLLPTHAVLTGLRAAMWPLRPFAPGCPLARKCVESELEANAKLLVRMCPWRSGVLCPLKLELQKVGKHLIGVLGTERVLCTGSKCL